MHISMGGQRAGVPSDSFQAEIPTPAAGNGAHDMWDPAGWFMSQRNDPQPTQESQPRRASPTHVNTLCATFARAGRAAGRKKLQGARVI